MEKDFAAEDAEHRLDEKKHNDVKAVIENVMVERFRVRNSEVEFPADFFATQTLVTKHLGLPDVFNPRRASSRRTTT